VRTDGDHRNERSKQADDTPRLRAIIKPLSCARGDYLFLLLAPKETVSSSPDSDVILRIVLRKCCCFSLGNEMEVPSEIVSSILFTKTTMLAIPEFESREVTFECIG